MHPPWAYPPMQKSCSLTYFLTKFISLVTLKFIHSDVSSSDVFLVLPETRQGELNLLLYSVCPAFNKGCVALLQASLILFFFPKFRIFMLLSSAAAAAVWSGRVAFAGSTETCLSFFCAISRVCRAGSICVLQSKTQLLRMCVASLTEYYSFLNSVLAIFGEWFPENHGKFLNNSFIQKHLWYRDVIFLAGKQCCSWHFWMVA